MPPRSARAAAIGLIEAGEDEAPTPVERSYLEVLGYLASRGKPVIAVQLARWFKVRPPTVTHVLQRLEQKQLIQRDGTSGIVLTATGAAIANQVIRRHRLLERFLYDTLQVPWHAVHREASLMEPTLSPLLEARIVALVGDATTCPHGNPIPGQSAPPDDIALLDLPPGSWFILTRVDEEAGEDSCTLQQLSARGLLPGTPLVRLPDASGAVRIQHAGRRLVLSRRVAGFLYGCTQQPGTPPAEVIPKPS